MKRIKRNTFIVGFALLFISTVYYVDRKFYMPQRIKKYLWEWEAGEHSIFGDFIVSREYCFNGDTMIFYTGKKAILRYQYFDTLSIRDVETDNVLTYGMKGTNWWESIWK